LLCSLSWRLTATEESETDEFSREAANSSAQTAMNAIAVLAMIALLLASWRDTGYILAAIALAS